MSTAPAYLLDTNILLRLSKRDSPEYPMIRAVLRTLYGAGNPLCYTSQNLIEFWNVSTRPADRNGHGLSVRETDESSRHIERAFQLLPDNADIHREWRKLVLAHEVRGAQVHDARIVAAMKVHGVRHLLTLNDRDFARYSEIAALHPSRAAV